MKSYSKITKYSEYELLETCPKNQNLVFIDGVFYQPPNKDYEKLKKEGDSYETVRIPDSKLGMILSVLLIGFSILLAPSLIESSATESFSIPIFLLIMILNVVIHEFAHFLSLKLYLHRTQLRFGFHVYFPFPSFYVDTTYALFLPRFKRITVFLAGLAANAIFIIAVWFLSLPLAIYMGAIYSLFVFNLIPILKNDAFHVMQELRNRPNYVNKKISPRLESFLRGSMMIGALIVLQCLFQVLSSY